LIWIISGNNCRNSGILPIGAAGGNRLEADNGGPPRQPGAGFLTATAGAEPGDQWSDPPV